MAILSEQMLKNADACFVQRRRFVELFGKKVNVTEEVCLQHYYEFNWVWAKLNLANDIREYFTEHSDYSELKQKHKNILKVWAILFARMYNSKENAEHRKMLRRNNHKFLE